jgi:Flp pilus assembly protein TadG
MRRDGGVAGRSRPGQTTAEFALIVVIFALIVFGIADFSRATHARNVVSLVAREGARYAATRTIVTPAELEAFVEHAKRLAVGLNTSLMQVNLSSPGPDQVQVDVTYTFQPVSILIARYVDGGSGAGLLLRGRSVMRREP